MSDMFSPRIGARHETARKLHAHIGGMCGGAGKENVDEIRELREKLSASQSFALQINPRYAGGCRYRSIDG
ncbi:hypothetical protein [Pleomorphomonas sp. T1.2MG-36]|uniref:hypothetical protein n=1 Tax=Pleomorphomonas sp. T1.2MG-36 TaxID=3041167 RepID=UPI0025412D69|nr:hypothetical protein [Pleomorphomonas sp. T1.2MG-36]